MNHPLENTAEEHEQVRKGVGHLRRAVKAFPRGTYRSLVSAVWESIVLEGSTENTGKSIDAAIKYLQALRERV